MTVSPSESTTFPVTAKTNIAAHSDHASVAKTPSVRYGLSDPNPSALKTRKKKQGNR